MPATQTRPMRYCDVCGGLDDHPRHVTAVREGGRPSDEFLAALGDGPAAAMAQLVDPTTIVRHLDCCAAQGCPVCTATEAATAGKRGHDLLDAIQAGALDDVTHDANGEPI